MSGKLFGIDFRLHDSVVARSCNGVGVDQCVKSGDLVCSQLHIDRPEIFLKERGVLIAEALARRGAKALVIACNTATAAAAEAIRAAVELMPEFVEINDLHRKASHAIANATGAAAGFVLRHVAHHVL